MYINYLLVGKSCFLVDVFLTSDRVNFSYEVRLKTVFKKTVNDVSCYVNNKTKMILKR